MAIHSTNINKTNNQLCPLILTELTEHTQKKTTTYDIGYPCPGLGQAQKCDRFKLVNEIPGLPS